MGGLLLLLLLLPALLLPLPALLMLMLMIHCRQELAALAMSSDGVGTPLRQSDRLRARWGRASLRLGYSTSRSRTDADQQPLLHFLLMKSMMRQHHFPGSGVRPTPVDSLPQVAAAKAARLGAARRPLPMMSRRRRWLRGQRRHQSQQSRSRCCCALVAST